MGLFANEIDETKKEEGSEEIEHPIAAAGAACEELKKSITGEAEAEAVSDGPREGDGRDGEEGGDANLRVVPVDFAEAGEHKATDQDESGRGSEGGDCSDEGHDEEREEEKDSSDDGGDTCAASCGDSGGGFDVAGYGAGACEGAENGGGCVGEEDAVEAWDRVVGRDEAGALGDCDERADVVEEVDEEEDKDDFESSDVERAKDVEVEGRCLDGSEIVGGGLPMDLVAEYAYEHGGEDADKHGGSDAEDLQEGDE